jgi:transcriptional regulator with XRE-family HTH domain
MMSSANAVRNMRIGILMEQEEFAQKLGITKSAICNYERGVRTPRISIIKKMRDLAKENGIDFCLEDFFNKG